MYDAELINKVVQRYHPLLPGRAWEFLNRVYGKSLDIYYQRLLQYKIYDFGRVLDAGCGFGQWTLALAKLNGTIEACDLSPERIAFLRDLISELKINNVNVSCQNLAKLTYESESFEAVFCYSCIFLTSWRKTLGELARVLRPGGKIYLSANGFGWYKHLWFSEHNKGNDYDPRLVAAQALLNTWRFRKGLPTEDGVDIIIESDELQSELASLGFSHIEMAAEGCLNADDPERAKAQAFFQGEYGGDLGVYEMMAIKGDGPLDAI
jgi:SAM-dependent methyltransferase